MRMLDEILKLSHSSGDGKYGEDTPGHLSGVLLKYRQFLSSKEDDSHNQSQSEKNANIQQNLVTFTPPIGIDSRGAIRSSVSKTNQRNGFRVVAPDKSSLPHASEASKPSKKTKSTSLQIHKPRDDVTGFIDEINNSILMKSDGKDKLERLKIFNQAKLNHKRIKNSIKKKKIHAKVKVKEQEGIRNVWLEMYKHESDPKRKEQLFDKLLSMDSSTQENISNLGESASFESDEGSNDMVHAISSSFESSEPKSDVSNSDVN